VIIFSFKLSSVFSCAIGVAFSASEVWGGGHKIRLVKVK
jgi:hypothetical protein